jgi:hypothetical protein
MHGKYNVKFSLTSFGGQTMLMGSHLGYAFHGIGRCNLVLVCSQNSAVSKVRQDQWVRNVLLVDAQGFDNSFLERAFCHLTTVYQLKKYEYPQLAPAVSASSSCSF